MDIALYQPDIAQNTGTLLRLSACMGLTLHIIHPSGFPITPQNLARAGLDYVEHASMRQHDSFEKFDAWRVSEGRRLVLLTTKASQSAYETSYAAGDILLLGRESAGVPDSVAERSALRVRIPMRPGLRSINVALAGSMIVGEALRQIGAFSALHQLSCCLRAPH
ncbi:MAG: tRNA (cytidine(34)-2'-O)-methyltransferase [Hyphomicrobiales bacterium]|nr:MAG: tRNA (cytidine(34)-2'-O)-methyltransferase [Hyphomicrobiales bacterium]